MFSRFLATVQDIYAAAQAQGRLAPNPRPEVLRAMALEEPEVRETRYGNIVALSEPTSRAKPFTRTSVDDAFGPAEEQLLRDCAQALANEPLVSIDVGVGDGADGITARLLVPRRFAHVAYGGAKLFRQLDTPVAEPFHTVVMFFDHCHPTNCHKSLPDKDITIRNALSDDGRLVKIVRNSNYLGEWKKGIFTGENWRAKRQGALFLHAGCRLDWLEQARGGHQAVASLFIALSANGKTTLTSKVLAATGSEESWLIQDDGGSLQPNGSFRGFEPGGIFVKTEGLSPRDMETYYGVLKPSTFLENVHVTADGGLDFFHLERTANGRAVIERRDFMHAGLSINVPRVDNIFLITRGNIIPALSQLTTEEAVAFMILGQSMESSAGDPTQAGKIKNVFFYDPFLAGDRTDHAHRFQAILRANPHIRCYLINTGGVGEGERYHDIGPAETMLTLNAILRGELKDWVRSAATGLRVPAAMPGVDPLLFHPERLYTAEVFAQRQAVLNATRRNLLAALPGLDPTVARVFGGSGE